MLVGWWGFVFPLGVYSVSTILIGEELPSLFFRVLGTIFSAAVILLWIVVALGTVRGAWSGELFHAPCLANLKPRETANVQGEKEKGLNGGPQQVATPVSQEEDAQMAQPSG